MNIYRLDGLEPREVFQGFEGKFVHSNHMTAAYWRINAGAVAPEHSHRHEQMLSVLEGTFMLTVGDETEELGPGCVVTIPSGVKHSAKAVTECRVLDIFYPVRDDLKIR
jgi:quercetin dioxygenase-like cupin family protein